MLINTVMLFTRELLPVLLLLGALMLWLPGNTVPFLLFATAMGLALLLSLVPFLEYLAEWANGNGLDVLFAACHAITLLTLVMTVLNRAKLLSAVIPLALMTLQCGLNLVIYSLGRTESAAGLEGFWLGVVLATGIGLSIAVLWHQLLAEIYRVWPRSLIIVIGLMSARHSSELFKLFEQMDWFASVPPLWNSSALISEQSEAGIFFHALFGYEASPAPLQMGIWSLMLVAVALLARREGGRT